MPWSRELTTGRDRALPDSATSAKQARGGGRPARLWQWGMDGVYGALGAVVPIYAGVRLASEQKLRSRGLAYLRDLPARWGRRRRRLGSRPCVWVHGVSVGEVKAAARLVKRIEESVPGVEVVISVTTDTGHRVARRTYPDHRVEFYPPDLSWIVGDALDALRPNLVVLIESEIWPNFLLETQRRGIPVALVNGRMSERSARRFHALRRFTLPLFQGLRRVCVQVPLYEERFRRVGLAEGRVHVTGNMKFDNIPMRPDAEQRAQLEALMGTLDDIPTLVAGSTHPGEEVMLIEMVGRLRGEGAQVRLILVPRHPGRAEAVAGQVKRRGQIPALRSQMTDASAPGPQDILILDTVGELEAVYALADLVFVGGSLVPHGGQNVMEPASIGKPVVVGPHTHNFRGEVDMLLQVEGIVSAPDAAGVELVLRTWLNDPTTARALGDRGRDVILGSKGATERTIELLAPELETLNALRERASSP